jgi:hypothetical protein
MYYEISDDTIEKFNSIFSKKSFPVSVKFQYLGNEKQKNLIKISKVPDQFSFVLGKELLVSINEDLMNKFDEDSINILMEQEINKISINIDSGKIKLIKPDLTTFSSLISKHGIEKVGRANQVEDLYNQQLQDDKEII